MKPETSSFKYTLCFTIKSVPGRKESMNIGINLLHFYKNLFPIHFRHYHTNNNENDILRFILILFIGFETIYFSFDSTSRTGIGPVFEPEYNVTCGNGISIPSLSNRSFISTIISVFTFAQSSLTNQTP